MLILQCRLGEAESAQRKAWRTKAFVRPAGLAGGLVHFLLIMI